MAETKKFRQASNEELKRAADITFRADAMLKAKEVYSRRWPDFERVWKMVEEGRTGEDAWRADLPETWSFATIKTANAAFADGKIIPTIIRHEDDPKSKSEDLRDLYSDIAEKGNMDEEIYFARLDTFRLGNGFLKTIYVKDKRKVWDIKKFDPNTNEFTWEEKEIIEFDDPKSIRVSPYLILKDDLARASWDTCRDFIELEVVSRDEAKRRYPDVDWDRVPQANSIFKRMTVGAQTNVAESGDGGLRGSDFDALRFYHFFAPGFDWSNDVVELMNYWNKGITTPSGAQDSYEILANGYPVKVDTAKKKSPNPYIHKQIPFTQIMYSPYSGDEGWAAGIIEIGWTDARQIKKNREKMDDRQSLSLFAPAFSDVNDEIDQKDVKLKPLSIIRTKGGVPKFAQIPGITNSDLALLDRHELSYKRATGIDDRVLGLESAGPRLTATEINTLREAALRRLRDFSFLYRNALLHREIKFKFSLFKQYFSNPLTREDKQKKDRGNRALKMKFKEFKVKTDNVYSRKEVNPNFFEGEVDVDLSLDVLMPMTQAQMTAMWGQILRDAVPFVQAGIIDISLSKVFGKYLEALGTNINTLKEDRESMSVEMAESEHNLFADVNTSTKMREVLPEGTDKKFLSEAHLLKHSELLDSDVYIEDKEKALLLAHIQKDIENWRVMQAEQQKPNLQALSSPLTGQVGGMVPQGVPVTPPTPATPSI